MMINVRFFKELLSVSDIMFYLRYNRLVQLSVQADIT